MRFAPLHVLLASSVLVLEACGESAELKAEPTEPVSLIVHEAWFPVPADEDPLVAHRPAEVDCPVAAWGVEGQGLEVQTGVCNYFTVAQPISVALEPGDEVRLRLWHDLLDAEVPGEAHVALAVDGQVLDEMWVEIPRDAWFEELIGVVEDPVPLGAPIALHLHNHGFNSWTFVSVEWVP